MTVCMLLSKALVKRSDEHSLKKKSKAPKQVTTKKTDTKEAKAERAPPVEQKNARKVSGVSPSVIKLSQQIEVGDHDISVSTLKC